MEEPKQQVLIPHEAKMEAIARERERLKEELAQTKRQVELSNQAQEVRLGMESDIATPEFFAELDDMFANGLIEEDVYNTLLGQVNFAIDLIIKATGGRGFIADDSPTQEI